VPTPTTPKKRVPVRKRAAAKASTPRKRAAKRAVATVKGEVGGGLDDISKDSRARRLPTGESEQLIIALAALGSGVLGLAIHLFWIVSIVLMALLAGLIGAEARHQRGHGLVAEVVAEARAAIDDMGKPGVTSITDATAEASPDSEPDKS
jgi:hypothetical protein